MLDSRSNEIDAMKINFDVAPTEVFRNMYIALSKCYDQREVDHDLEVPSPGNLKFQALETILKSSRFKKL